MDLFPGRLPRILYDLLSDIGRHFALLNVYSVKCMMRILMRSCVTVEGQSDEWLRIAVALRLTVTSGILTIEVSMEYIENNNDGTVSKRMTD